MIQPDQSVIVFPSGICPIALNSFPDIGPIGAGKPLTSTIGKDEVGADRKYSAKQAQQHATDEQDRHNINHVPTMKLGLSSITTWRIRGVQSNSEFILKCTMELTKLKPATNSEARPT